MPKCEHKVVWKFSLQTREREKSMHRLCAKDRANKHHKGTCFKEIGLHLRIPLTTPRSIMRIIGRTHDQCPGRFLDIIGQKS